MERARFVRVVEEVLDALPWQFRRRIHNLAVLVEDRSPVAVSRQGLANADLSGSAGTKPLVLGTFEGVPATKRSVFHLPAGPDRIILYQRNIEAVCCNEAEIRHEIRQTVLHELGHYFGMDEAQLEDV